MTTVAETAINTTQFAEHHCLEVHCTGCNEALGEDWTIHYDSLPAVLSALRDADWTVTGDDAFCPDCQPDENTPNTSTAVVHVCEFCWPPLIPSDNASQICTCESPDRTTPHYFTVPVITGAHPALVHTECITLQCRDCDEPFGTEEAPAHYRSRAKAIEAAMTDDDEPWSQDGNGMFCDRCTARRRCKENDGHTFPEQPHWTNPNDGTQIRYCDDCDEIQRITPERDDNDHEPPTEDPAAALQ
ncbi:hypothetical protein P5V34_11435 [Mycobacteroides abscessus subsp. abscessus]|jgi:hypothetical protein|uniref:hypothetical protein n=1 Tax=Mycobacteroides abscessus TaxID=36809 RepID=UPI00266D9F96|nr:hypothetical protein [Mycobacteroides abscessus]MDO3014599.1 hypothetical protein [Mycobacteroides abscessus subsp. abscessus]